jgi:hypothetical protein
MDGIIRIASEHNLIAVAAGFVFLMAIYFLFKSLMKIALVLLIAVIAIGGYYYFQRPGACPSSAGEVVSQAKRDSAKVVETGRNALKKTKELAAKGRSAYEKGKEVVKEGREMADKKAEKGTDFVEKVKMVIAKIFLLAGGRDDEREK